MTSVHNQQTGHEINYDQINILGQNSHYYKRLHLEALHINRYQSTIFNGNVGKTKINTMWNPVIHKTKAYNNTVDMTKPPKKLGNTRSSIPTNPTHSLQTNQEKPVARMRNSELQNPTVNANISYFLRSSRRVQL